MSILKSQTLEQVFAVQTDIPKAMLPVTDASFRLTDLYSGDQVTYIGTIRQNRWEQEAVLTTSVALVNERKYLLEILWDGDEVFSKNVLVSGQTVRDYSVTKGTKTFLKDVVSNNNEKVTLKQIL